MNLSASEIRVLGCLLEKRRTTPDVYPLSLNSLRLACNQSTNRDPVVQYDEAVLRDALHRLERRGYTRLASGAGSRAAKYRHLLAEALPMSDDEQAVMTVLMLRGPQTPGELKQRAERMQPFADLAAVHDTLARLIARELVAELERRPGQKEERYTQLLGGEVEASATVAGPPVGRPRDGSGGHFSEPPSAGALTALEERVARLERHVAELHAALTGTATSAALGGAATPAALGGAPTPAGLGGAATPAAARSPSGGGHEEAAEGNDEQPEAEETLEWT